MFALVAAFGLTAWACRAPEAQVPVGMSTATLDAESSRAPEPPRARWADFAAARSWPEAAPRTQALVHYRDGTLIHVRVAPPGLDAYRALAEEAPMPDSARVMAWHESPAGELLGGYLLEKSGGVWRAREVDARGGLLPGDGARCLRCHAMVPTDHLFGVRGVLDGAAR